MMTQFSKLSLNQPQAKVNTIQQHQTWCEIYSGSGHTADLYIDNPKFINFKGNA